VLLLLLTSRRLLVLFLQLTLPLPCCCGCQGPADDVIAAPPGRTWMIVSVSPCCQADRC
jgi:hypothetical protein